MANRQRKSQPRNTTNIVVRNGPAASQAGPSRAAQARRRRNRKKQQVNIRVLTNKIQGRRRNPRVQGIGSRVVFQKINSTLGTVGSNGSEQIECELTCLLNPATMKEATGSNSFTPLSIYASTYSLFRMTKCTLVLKPLIGDNAVSGTVVRASWNPTSNPSQASWSALGARKHIDVTPGREGRFTLTSKDLKGPKGGWFKTNTKGDPMMSFAGTLEIHTLGKTRSTYQNGQFTGGLFLAEMEVVWQFKEYSQQPGMLNLVKGEDTGNTTVSTDNDGKLQLKLPQNSRMAKAATSAANEIIWLVTDTVIQLAASGFPPPFGWLIRGGWWLVKRAAGAPVRDGTVTFDIYASISDARSNTPCMTEQRNASPISIGNLHFQQVTPGSAGIGTDLTIARTVHDEQSQAPPQQCYVTTATMYKLGTEQVIPAACKWYNNAGGQKHNKGVGFRVENTNFATFNIFNVTASTDVGSIHRSMFPHSVPIYLFDGRTQRDLGVAVASTYSKIETNPTLWVSSVLFCATTDINQNFPGNWNTTTVTYPKTRGSDDFQAEIYTPDTRRSTAIHMNFRNGEWYIAQFVVHGYISGQYVVGDNIVASIGRDSVTQGSQYFHAPTTVTWAHFLCTCLGSISHHSPRTALNARLIARSLKPLLAVCPVIWIHHLAVTIRLSFHHLLVRKILQMRGLRTLKIQRMMRMKNLSLAQMMTIRTHQYPGWGQVLKPSRSMNNLGLTFQNGKLAWQQISCFQAVSILSLSRGTTTRWLMAYHLGKPGRLLWVSRMAPALSKFLNHFSVSFVI
nr:ORF2 [Mamastrovirus 3]